MLGTLIPGMTASEQLQFDALSSFSPTAYAAAATQTDEADWVETSGSKPGLGKEYWVRNTETGMQLYISRCGDHVEHDVFPAG